MRIAPVAACASFLALSAALPACSSPTETPDGGGGAGDSAPRDGGGSLPDTGGPVDAARIDTGTPDDAATTMDTGTADDAFVGPDAFVAPDAYVPPDAWTMPDGGTDGCELTTYPTLSLEPVSGTFRAPLAFVAIPGGGGDAYVVEHGGRIQIMRADGSNGGIFADLRSVTGNATGSNEQGLLGMALHPDYETNGLFWVYYAPVNGSTNVVAAGHRSTTNPDAAEGGVTPILTLTNDLYSNHNGGNLVFGPDGYLYIGTGDGGSGGDPQMHGQDIDTLYAKILRISVGPGIAAYEIPPTNPFVGTAGLDEIYAYGVRNPWRFSFDRLTHALFIGDVGQNAWEEIDVDTDGMGGDNYGWNVCEGTHAYGGGNCAALGQHAPIFEYQHSSAGFFGSANQSITGGVVYRGSEIPGLYGTYLFADEVVSRFGGLRYCGGVARDVHLFDELDGTCANPSSFGETETGEVYVTCVGGTVMRLVSP
ncbi:MAG: PQQ-dependent sugar dehydrogenase [Sandaracinus sp.]